LVCAAGGDGIETELESFGLGRNRCKLIKKGKAWEHQSHQISTEKGTGRRLFIGNYFGVDTQISGPNSGKGGKKKEQRKNSRQNYLRKG